MMVYLKGRLMYKGDGYVILENQGIGYKISLPHMSQTIDEIVELFIHEAVRDDSRELFGFSSINQLELFWKLIGVSGVGPRSAQKMVFSDNNGQLKKSIMEGDLSVLTSVPGIGKKTAQKIILELKGVLAQEPEYTSADSDAIDALVGLGYSRRDAQAALVGIEEEDTESRIRLALKNLSR